MANEEKNNDAKKGRASAPGSISVTPVHNRSRRGSGVLFDPEDRDTEVKNSLARIVQCNANYSMMKEKDAKKEDLEKMVKKLETEIARLNRVANRDALERIAEDKKTDVKELWQFAAFENDTLLFSTKKPEFRFRKEQWEDPYKKSMSSDEHKQVREIAKSLKDKFPNLLNRTTSNKDLNYFMITLAKYCANFSRSQVYAVIDARFDQDLLEIFDSMIINENLDGALANFINTYAMAKSTTENYRGFMDMPLDPTDVYSSYQAMMKAATLAFPHEKPHELEVRTIQKIESNLKPEVQNLIQKEIYRHNQRFRDQPITGEIYVAKLEKILMNANIAYERPRQKKMTEIAAMQSGPQNAMQHMQPRQHVQHVQHPQQQQPMRQQQYNKGGKPRFQQNQGYNANNTRKPSKLQKIPLEWPTMKPHTDALEQQYDLKNLGFIESIKKLAKDAVQATRIVTVPLNPKQMPNPIFMGNKYKLNCKGIDFPFIATSLISNRKFITAEGLRHFRDKCWRCGLKGCNPASPQCPMIHSTPTFNPCERCKAGLHQKEQCRVYLENSGA